MDVTVARQAIFDTDQKTIGAALTWTAPKPSADVRLVKAQEEALGTVANLGTANWGRDLRPILPVPFEMLVAGSKMPFGPGDFVVLVPSSPGPRSDLLAACRQLGDDGYTLWLDDSDNILEMRPYMDLFHGVAVDFSARGYGYRKLLAVTIGQSLPLTALSVTAHTDFDMGRELGYQAFAGSFVTASDIDVSGGSPDVRHQALRLLQEANRPEFDPDRIEEIVKDDAGTAHALLRFVNSASFATRHEITSIRQAVVMLGQVELRKLASVLAVGKMATQHPTELLRISLNRARRCELLAHATGAADPNLAFLTGLLSVLDALLGLPMDDALGTVTVSRTAKAALRGSDGPLRAILDTVFAYERSDRQGIVATAASIGVPVFLLTEQYIEAYRWADDLAPA